VFAIESWGLMVLTVHGLPIYIVYIEVHSCNITSTALFSEAWSCSQAHVLRIGLMDSVHGVTNWTSGGWAGLTLVYGRRTVFG
jgi:hypothetical protein